MNSLITIIKSDYIQRTRNYNFVVTLFVSLAIAYTFIPEPNANYSTISVNGYVGFYNASWFGYVTAIMSTIFLSLIGFYLINSSIQKDIDTKLGLIIASTPLRNSKYLFTKVISNFLILFTIVLAIFCMSILLFFMYNDGYTFEFTEFLVPYLSITLPAMFIISVIAVIFEITLGRYTTIMNITFFFLFAFLVGSQITSQREFTLDVLGSKIAIHEIENQVQLYTNNNIDDLEINIGFTSKGNRTFKKFEFKGMSFPLSFIYSRFLWMGISLLTIPLISLFFHRFDIKNHIKLPNSLTRKPQKAEYNKIDIKSLKDLTASITILPLLKTEFMLLIRTGNVWLWLLNGIGFLILSIVPTTIGHQFVLPILWFLQVHRISRVTVKEFMNNTYYFCFTSNKPLLRLLSSQVLSATALLILLATPLLVKLSISGSMYQIITILLGALFIVLLSSVIGLLTKGKKFFEILFFMITYANINAISLTDYFGGLSSSNVYLFKLITSCIILAFVTFSVRNFQLKTS